MKNLKGWPSREEVQRLAVLRALKEHREKCERDPAFAKRWMIENGFLTEDGNLHSNYGGKDHD